MSESQIPNIYIARQPIYTPSLEVYGYELLYRNNEQNRATITDGDMASSQVVVNAFIEIGLDQLVGSKKAFINVTQGFILGNFIESLPTENLVMEILEDIQVDSELISRVKNCYDNGIAIALDDFTLTDNIKPLIPFATIIKLDIMALDKPIIEKYVSALKKLNVILLAEKVETYQEFEYCKELKFDLFQGYFFCQPKIVHKERLPSNRVSLMQLLTKLQDPDADFEELEKIISQDVGLSYKLLRIINSASFGFEKKIDSLYQALVLIGIKNIRNWATMITLTNIDEKPNELLVASILRAKMCDLQARYLGVKNPEAYFTAGLFSTLDAMMDQPLDALLEPLPLSHELNQAILQHKGAIGTVLENTIRFERGDWNQLHSELIDPTNLQSHYLEALDWTKEICSYL